MTNLIKSDLYKLFKSKAFYVCIIILIFVYVFAPIMYSIANKYLEQLTEENPELVGKMTELEGGVKIGVGMSLDTFTDSGEEVDAIWFINKVFSDNTFVYIISIFITIFVTREFLYNSIRNVVSKGFNRKSIYLSKLVVSSIASIIMACSMIIATGISSAIVFGVNEITYAIVLETIGLMGIQFLIILGFTCFFVMIGMVIRNSTLTIIVNMLILVAVQPVLQLFNYIVGKDINLQRYWLLDNIVEMSKRTVQHEDVIRCLICALIYIVISTIIGMEIFKRKDIE